MIYRIVWLLHMIGTDCKVTYSVVTIEEIYVVCRGGKLSVSFG